MVEVLHLPGPKLGGGGLSNGGEHFCRAREKTVNTHGFLFALNPSLVLFSRHLPHVVIQKRVSTLVHCSGSHETLEHIRAVLTYERVGGHCGEIGKERAETVRGLPSSLSCCLITLANTSTKLQSQLPTTSMLECSPASTCGKPS